MNDRLVVQMVARLNEALAETNTSQAELSRLTGLSTKHVNQMVQGKIAAVAMFDFCITALGYRCVLSIEQEG